MSRYIMVSRLAIMSDTCEGKHRFLFDLAVVSSPSLMEFVCLSVRHCPGNFQLPLRQNTVHSLSFPVREGAGNYELIRLAVSTSGNLSAEDPIFQTS
jgi:hypothetical protein